MSGELFMNSKACDPPAIPALSSPGAVASNRCPAEMRRASTRFRRSSSFRGCDPAETSPVQPKLASSSRNGQVGSVGWTAWPPPVDGSPDRRYRGEAKPRFVAPVRGRRPENAIRPIALVRESTDTGAETMLLVAGVVRDGVGNRATLPSLLSVAVTRGGPTTRAFDAEAECTRWPG